MGGASSKNVSEAIQKVTNKISNDTIVDSQQVTDMSNNIDFNKCIVNADKINISALSEAGLKNKQIADVFQQTDTTNDLQQSILQSAESSVGALGIGYASASNASSMFVNASTDISQAVQSTANQYSFTNQNFQCKDSVFLARGDFNLNLSSSGQLLSDQTVKNKQAASIANKISQKASQKATAKVEGMAMIIIALAILLGSLGYTVSKPLSGGGMKLAIAVITVILLATVGSFMFIRKTPPFFDDNTECTRSSKVGCNDECINYKEKTMKVSDTPLKYIYGLLPGDSSKPNANLLEMIVGFGSGDARKNGGYNASRADKLNKDLSETKKEIITAINEGKIKDISESDITSIPDILVVRKKRIPDEYIDGRCTPGALKQEGEDNNISKCPSIAKINDIGSDEKIDPYRKWATLNEKEWRSYVNKDDKYAKIARFVLFSLTGSSYTNVYMHEDELISYTNDNGETVLGRVKDNEDHKKYCVKFIPRGKVGFKDGLVSEGNLNTEFGVCNDNNYKLHKGLIENSKYILIAISVIFGIVLFLKPISNIKNVDIKGFETKMSSDK